MSTVLDPNKLHNIFIDCLLVEGVDIKEDTIQIEGINCEVIFSKNSLAVHRTEIVAMLNELSPSFKNEIDGGNSFLAACMDKNDQQWGEHPDVERLYMLGLGLEMIITIPRELWEICPGGMPYFIVKSD